MGAHGDYGDTAAGTGAPMGDKDDEPAVGDEDELGKAVNRGHDPLK